MTHPSEGIEWFSQEMAAKFSQNSHKRGWDEMGAYYGISRLREEVRELEDEIVLHDAMDPEAIIQECADVANFALMVAWGFRYARHGIRTQNSCENGKGSPPTRPRRT